MSGIKAYLAEKYMSGPKADAILSRAAPQKKKKRKNALAAPTASTSFVRDDDGGWGDEGKEEDVEDVAEAVVASDRGFKKRKLTAAEEETGWTTIQEGASAVKEESPAADEQPMVVDDSPAPFLGGLVTAKQLKKVLPQNVSAGPSVSAEEMAMAQETVYRDATGRKIDTKAARAEAARLKREKEEKEAQKMEWGKGLVQKEEEEKKRLELEKQRGRAFARHADDADLNEEQKAKDLWNDPAAAFLSVSNTLSNSNVQTAQEATITEKETERSAKASIFRTTSTAKPLRDQTRLQMGWRRCVTLFFLVNEAAHKYTCFSLVDRGNGWEKKLFQSKNERKRKGLESYQWSVDDM